MSYTTRCPACGTTFKVVPDQLKISDGWVRCGHCADVFDATLYLQAWSAPEPAPAPAAAEAVPADMAPSAQVPVSPPDPESPAEAELEPEPEPGVAQDEVQQPLPAGSADATDARDDFQAELARFAAQAARPAPEVPACGAAIETPAPPPAFSEPPADADDDPPADEVPDFVRQARRQAFWRLPGVQAGMLLLTVLLAVSLALQWAVHERDRLAALHPQLAPWLTRLCGPLQCEIAPPRDIEAVVIDSSTLVRRLGSVYAFDVVLKNTADMAVAVPALELSLTDTGDRVMARRVFLPGDLPGGPVQLPAHGSVALNLRLSISDAGSVPMAGYRALVFYP